MVKIIGKLSELSGLWVFIVSNTGNNETLYIGCEKLKTIPTLRELKRHALGSLDNATLTLELYAPVDTFAEGEQLVATLNAIYNPRYTKKGPTPKRRVRCNDTGEEYENAHQAANAYGLSYSYLHYHLQGHPSYKRCKGLTFSYIEA